MLNEVSLIGRIGRDPEFKSISEGSDVLNIAVGTNESYKDKEGDWQEKTTWHDVQVWGEKKAKSYAKRLQKGDLIYVAGKLDYNDYEDQNGSKQRRAKVKAFKIERLKWSE